MKVIFDYQTTKEGFKLDMSCEDIPTVGDSTVFDKKEYNKCFKAIYHYIGESRMKEVEANLPKLKWQILNQEEADKRHIHIILVNEETTLLSIDLAYIPCGMSWDEYIMQIQKDGIVMQLTPDGKPVEFEQFKQ